MTDLPNRPTFEPGAFLLLGEDDEQRKELRKALRKGRPNRQTPYQTPEQYQQLINDCVNFGKRVSFSSSPDENLVYHQHPYNTSVYSRTDTQTKETVLWFESNSATGQWKQLVHNGVYDHCVEQLYQKVLDREIEYEDTGNPVENKKDFASLLSNKFQMCESGGCGASTGTSKITFGAVRRNSTIIPAGRR